MESNSGMEEQRPRLFSQLLEQLNNIQDSKVLDLLWDKYRVEDYYR